MLDLVIRSYYGTSVPGVLVLMGGFGYCVLNSILGGQAISGLANGHLSWTYGHIHHLIAYLVSDSLILALALLSSLLYHWL